MRRILIIVLGCMLVLFLVSCGDNDSSNNENDTGTVEDDAGENEGKNCTEAEIYKFAHPDACGAAIQEICSPDGEYFCVLSSTCCCIPCGWDDCEDGIRTKWESGDTKILTEGEYFAYGCHFCITDEQCKKGYYYDIQNDGTCSVDVGNGVKMCDNVKPYSYEEYVEKFGEP